KVALYLFVESRSAADEITNAATHAFVNRIEQQLAEVQRGLVAQPGIESHQQVSGFADQLAAMLQARFDAAVQQFPKRGHAYHPGNVSVLDGLGQMFTAQFRQISDL